MFCMQVFISFQIVLGIYGMTHVYRVEIGPDRAKLHPKAHVYAEYTKKGGGVISWMLCTITVEF